MRRAFALSLLALSLSAPVSAQVQPKAYAPEDLTILREEDQIRVIAKEYMEQSGNREIPDDQLDFYLDQIDSGWTFGQIKEDIARSLRGGRDWDRDDYDRYDDDRPGNGYGWGPPVTGAGRVVRCESIDQRPRECATQFRRRAAIVRQHSRTRCVEGQNWGQRPGMVWVNRGCRAEFAETGGAWDGGTAYSVTCTSNYERYTTCAWNSRYGRPVLIETLSRERCVEGRNWGYRGSSIWVDDGCRGRFGPDESGYRRY
jgi:hypothetical protein